MEDFKIQENDNMVKLQLSQSNNITFNIKNEPIIVIDEKGFTYKGELVENSKDVADSFRKFFNDLGK